MSALGKISNNHSVRVLKDGVRIFNSVSSPNKIAIAKATREHVKGPPKEKHVKTLIAETRSVSACNEIIEALRELIRGHSWVRVLKGLQVFHRLIQDGHPNFTKALIQMRPVHVLRMSSFRDTSSNKGMGNTPFIRAYGDYLISRAMMYKVSPKLRHLSRKIDVEALCSNVTAKDPSSLFKIIKPIQQLLDDLLYCRATEVMLENGATLSAFSLLLKDSFAVYKILSDSMIILLDHYFNMTKNNATKALELYENHIKQTESLVDLYEMCRSIRGIRASSIPHLKPQPKSLLKNMREYLENENYKKNEESAGDDDDYVEAQSQPLSEVLTEEDMEPISRKGDTKGKQSSSSNNVPDMFIIDNVENDKDSSDSDGLMSFAKPNPQAAAGNNANPFESGNTQGYSQQPPYGYQQPGPYGYNQQGAQSFNQGGAYGYEDQKNPFGQNNGSNPFEDDPFENPGPAKPAQSQPPKSSVLDDFLGM